MQLVLHSFLGRSDEWDGFVGAGTRLRYFCALAHAFAHPIPQVISRQQAQITRIWFYLVGLGKAPYLFVARVPFLTSVKTSYFGFYLSYVARPALLILPTTSLSADAVHLEAQTPAYMRLDLNILSQAFQALLLRRICARYLTDPVKALL